MSRTGLLILLGVLTMLTPFSGLPTAMRSILTLAFGVCVLGIGLAMRSHEAQRSVWSHDPTPPQTPPSGVSPI
ncbi:MAG: hypothetical protein WC790_03645 [Candidatus Paceibacterota bacterium]|jgi:uncharacterized membrane protein YqgA involved in biofilm formation